MRPPNITQFLFKNDDQILLIKESTVISHLISDFTYNCKDLQSFRSLYRL
jgi:hypothetical protein